MDGLESDFFANREAQLLARNPGQRAPLRVLAAVRAACELPLAEGGLGLATQASATAGAHVGAHVGAPAGAHVGAPVGAHGGAPVAGRLCWAPAAGAAASIELEGRWDCRLAL